MESSPKSKAVSLPSIHEMFPEHLLATQNGEKTSAKGSPKSESSPSPSSSKRPASPGQQSANGTPRVVSFDVLRSDPTSSSLQHLASSNTYPNRGAAMAMVYQSGVDRGPGAAPSFRVSVTSSPPPPAAPSDASASSSTAAEQTGRPRASNLPADMAAMYINDSQSRSTAAANAKFPPVISFPISGNKARSQEPAGDDANEDDDGPNEPSSGKKHVCPTCFKRFNRPSSLRIHVNTHTGATPFRCPWPNCGREFNVNSNMRRHYRNHKMPGFTAQHPGDVRRRRRRLSIGAEHYPEDYMLDHHSRRLSHDEYGRERYFGSDDSDGYDSDYAKRGPGHERYREYEMHRPSWSGHPHSIPRSSVVGSSRSSAPMGHASRHHPGYPPMYQGHHGSYHPGYPPPPPPPGYSSYRDQPPPPHSSRSASRPHPAAPAPSYQAQPYGGSPRHHPYPLPGARSYTPAASSFHSSSPSPSPSPPPQTGAAAAAPPRSHEEHALTHKEPVYSASIPYLRSVTESRVAVSTTLRPAFSSAAPGAERSSYATRPLVDAW